LLGNGSVNTFQRRQNTVTTPLLGQQILGNNPLLGDANTFPWNVVLINSPFFWDITDYTAL
jgi:hypothetical protein